MTLTIKGQKLVRAIRKAHGKKAEKILAYYFGTAWARACGR